MKWEGKEENRKQVKWVLKSSKYFTKTYNKGDLRERFEK